VTEEIKTVLLPEPIDDEAMKLLGTSGVNVLQAPSKTPEVVKPLMEMADGVVLRTGIRMSAELIESSKNLAAISRTGAGFDNVDIEAANRKGVIVSSSVGVNTHTVAEHTIALILALFKQLFELDSETRSGNFGIRYSYLPRDLRGGTLGVIGFGRIGREVAHICATSFGMRVLAFDKYLADDAKDQDASWVTFCNLSQLLEQSDVVTVHVPMNEETKGLLDAKKIARMKQGAFLVNTSRGGIIDEDALAKALDKGRIRGAGIDVFTQEPPAKTHQFLTTPSVILTPHAAALTENCVKQMAIQAVKRILDQFDGYIPDNIANPEILNNERWSILRPKQSQS
jgi:D-3-phosphoglycerate dehydrogenase